METSTPQDPVERWINKFTGEITRELGDRDRADWLHVTFKKNDPAERETIESYFALNSGEEAPATTWTAYFDGKPSHWLMQEYPENDPNVLPEARYGFIIVREEPQFADLDTCADAFALVAAVENDLLEASYRLSRDQRPHAVPASEKDNQP